MRLAQEHEAVFAAAAHYFTSIRSYQDAIEVLECCRTLTGYPEHNASTKTQLEAVNNLITHLFTGYPKAYVPTVAELAELRRALRKLKKLLLPALKRRRRMKTIYDFMRHVKKKPGFYMRRRTMESLRTVIDQALYPWQLKLSEGNPPFRSFPAWVNRRYRKFQGGGHAWEDVLLRAAGGDEEKAIKLFYSELRAFKKSEKE